MTRDEMIAEAKEIIGDVEGYSTKTGLVLNSVLSKMITLGCATKLATKEVESKGAGEILAGEVKLAEANTESIKRLGALVEMAGTVRCGGG